MGYIKHKEGAMSGRAKIFCRFSKEDTSSKKNTYSIAGGGVSSSRSLANAAIYEVKGGGENLNNKNLLVNHTPLEDYFPFKGLKSFFIMLGKTCS